MSLMFTISMYNQGCGYSHPRKLYIGIVAAYNAYKTAKELGYHPIICRVNSVDAVIYCNKHNLPGYVVM